MNQKPQKTEDRQPERAAEEHAQFAGTVKQYVRPVGFAVALLLLIAIGITFYQQRQKNKAMAATMTLFNARSVDDLQKVMEDYPSTASAPLARLKLAKAHFDNGSYTIAMETYDSFLEENPQHRFRDNARLGRIHCLEAQGRLEAAADEFKAFAEEKGRDHYLTPQALIGQARCLQQTGSYNEARQVYEKVLTEHENSAWAVRAEDLLMRVNDQIAGQGQGGEMEPQSLEPDALPAGPVLQQLSEPTNGVLPLK
jgi:tetratricopeptide (TPR) repeat protein